MGKVRTLRERPVLMLLLAIAGGGCKGANVDVSLSKAAPNETGIPNIPAPPADGPKLVATHGGVVVMDRPRRDGQAIGTLAAGAAVVRAGAPYKVEPACALGWYPIRPRGFVCASDGASLSAAPLPSRDAALPLPHRYARVRSATPLYTRVPTPDEQTENEPDLTKHFTRMKTETLVSRAGSNDVPLDENGSPIGAPMIKHDGPGVGPDGRRTDATFFDVPVAAPVGGSGPLVARALRRGSGLSVIGTFDSSGPQGTRRFGVTSDGSIVPIDRLEPAMGSTFTGVDLTKDKSLPLAFIHRHEVTPYEMKHSKAERLSDEEVGFRAAVFLTGRFRTVDSVRFEEGDDGRWLRDRDIVKVVKRTKFPEFVGDGMKWVDVSLALQTMTLYEGFKPVYATLVSSGSDVLGDPATSSATAQGVFKVSRKAFGAALNPLETQNAFEVLDAPWQLELSPEVSLIGSYWSDSFGEARMYHDVALSPVDAHRVFGWAGPEIPEGWASAVVSDAETITVNIRK